MTMTKKEEDEHVYQMDVVHSTLMMRSDELKNAVDDELQLVVNNGEKNQPKK